MRMLKCLKCFNFIQLASSDGSYDLQYPIQGVSLSPMTASTIAKLSVMSPRPGLRPQLTSCIASKVIGTIASASFVSAGGSPADSLDVAEKCASATFSSDTSLTIEPTGSDSGRESGISESLASQEDMEEMVNDSEHTEINQGFDVASNTEGAVICGSMNIINSEGSPITSIATPMGDISIPTVCPPDFESLDPSTVQVQFGGSWGTHQFDGVYCRKYKRHRMISGTTVTHVLSESGSRITISVLSVTVDGDIMLSLRSDSRIVLNGTLSGRLNPGRNGNGNGSVNGIGNGGAGEDNVVPINPLINSTVDLTMTISRPPSRRGGPSPTLSVIDKSGQVLLENYSGSLSILGTDPNSMVGWIKLSSRVSRVSLTLLSAPETSPARRGQGDQPRITYVLKAGTGTLAESIQGYMKLKSMVPLSNLNKFELLFALGRLRSQSNSSETFSISGQMFGVSNEAELGQSNFGFLYASKVKSAIAECRIEIKNKLNFAESQTPKATAQLPYSCYTDQEGGIFCESIAPGRRLAVEDSLSVCTVQEANTFAATSIFSLVVSSCLTVASVSSTSQLTLCMTNVLAQVGIQTLTRGCFECVFNFIMTQINLINVVSGHRKTCIQSPTGAACLENLDFRSLLDCSGGYDPGKAIIQPYCSQSEASMAVATSMYRTATATCYETKIDGNLWNCLGFIIDESDLSNMSPDCLICWYELLASISVTGQAEICRNDPTGNGCTSVLVDELQAFQQCSGFSATATDYERLVQLAKDSGSTSEEDSRPANIHLRPLVAFASVGLLLFIS